MRGGDSIQAHWLVWFGSCTFILIFSVDALSIILHSFFFFFFLGREEMRFFGERGGR